MTRVPVEIVIHASTPEATLRAALAAHAGGAARIEVCARMDVDGMTPAPDCVAAARAAFGARRGVMVMVRPTEGEFCYTAAELDAMIAQIDAAADAGADGVVVGALTPGHAAVDVPAMRRLCAAASARGLAVTCHRAVDATPDVGVTTDQLLNLGVQRVLTSGVAWGRKGGALDGLARLSAMVARAAGGFEVVLAGGMAAANVARVLAALPPGPVSVHAYGGVLVDGETDEARVRQLVEAAGTSPRAGHG